MNKSSVACLQMIISLFQVALHTYCCDHTYYCVILNISQFVGLWRTKGQSLCIYYLSKLYLYNTYTFANRVSFFLAMQFVHTYVGFDVCVIINWQKGLIVKFNNFVQSISFLSIYKNFHGECLNTHVFITFRMFCSVTMPVADRTLFHSL